MDLARRRISLLIHLIVWLSLVFYNNIVAGEISAPSSPNGFKFYIGAGRNFPRGDFADIVDDGKEITGGFAFLGSELVEARLFVTYSSYTDNGRTSEDSQPVYFDKLRLTDVYAELRLNLVHGQAVSPYIIFDAGASFISHTGNLGEAGIDIDGTGILIGTGAGLEFPTSENVSLWIEGKYSIPAFTAHSWSAVIEYDKFNCNRIMAAVGLKFDLAR